MRMRNLAALGLGVSLSLVSAVPALAATKTTTVATTATYGKVSSVGTNEFMMTVGKKTYTVTVDAKTVYQNAKSKVRTWDEIKKADKVWVWGKKSTAKLTITGVTKVKDMTVTK